jgi:predicted NACHT family NTPase
MEASFVGPMSEFDFKLYLSAIATHYEQWQWLYTLSDAEGRLADEKKGQFFEFGLMVERREEREKTEEGREKVERLDVLAGLRKYAAEHVLLVGRPGSGKSTVGH